MKAVRKILRVLLVEDSQEDADLILIELGKAGCELVCQRVETEIAMREAMKSGRWDIVISDYNLPRFNARKALAVLRETDEHTPFIIVSGCIGEESAIALMKEGASDFVMKDKLARLTPAVERELQDAEARRERRQALEALHANEKLLKGITSSLGEGIFVQDAEGRLVFMNPEAERLLGWSEAELLGKKMHQTIHSQNPDGTPLDEADCGVLGVLKTGRVFRTDGEVFLRKDGSLVPVSYIASAIAEDGQAVSTVTAFQDITRRKQAEQDLLESRKQLRELSSYLQTVREEERSRIARELHDELGQMLTAVKLDAMWLIKRMAGKEEAIRRKIDSMSQLIDETLDAMRRVAAALRPVMLDDLGMMAAIEWLIEDFSSRTGIDIQFERDTWQPELGCGGSCDKGSCFLNTAVATGAFRIVQECLTNIARHAQATQVKVFLKCREDKLRIWVSDDGKGMDSVRDVKTKAYGIIGMQERALALGGSLHISSNTGKGTRVEVALPIKLDNCVGACR